MARPRTKKASSTVPLAQPDRSPLKPSQETLLGLAEQRGLLAPVEKDEAQTDLDEPLVGRFGESVLWSLSLTMLHVTFDVLAQQQYAMELSWREVANSSLQAFGVIFLLFYTLHPHPKPPVLVPRIPRPVQQLVFFTTSVAAGSYLIHITNTYGYYAVMKRAPPLGVAWIWAVIELELPWAVASLACCAGYMWYGGYSYK